MQNNIGYTGRPDISLVEQILFYTYEHHSIQKDCFAHTRIINT